MISKTVTVEDEIEVSNASDATLEQNPSSEALAFALRAPCHLLTDSTLIVATEHLYDYLQTVR